MVQAGVDRRKKLFERKADRLFEIEIYYFIVLEGSLSKTGIRRPHDVINALSESKWLPALLVRLWLGAESGIAMRSPRK